MNWQPISTYKKDGTLVLLLFADGTDASHPTEDDEHWRTIGQNDEENTGDDFWNVAGWDWCHDNFIPYSRTVTPTHWCPLPEMNTELSKPGDNNFIGEEIHRRDELRDRRDRALERVQTLKKQYDEAILVHHNLVIQCAELEKKQ